MLQLRSAAKAQGTLTHRRTNRRTSRQRSRSPLQRSNSNSIRNSNRSRIRRRAKARAKVGHLPRRLRTTRKPLANCSCTRKRAPAETAVSIRTIRLWWQISRAGNVRPGWHALITRHRRAACSASMRLWRKRRKCTLRHRWTNRLCRSQRGRKARCGDRLIAAATQCWSPATVT